MRPNTLLAGLCCGVIALFTSCSEPCNGHIEGTVLYFAEAPNHQGQFVYANVLNKADLGVQHTLMRDDKEYGTFGHVIIIEDPQSHFKGQRSICFDEFKTLPTSATSRLDEQDIPHVTVLR